MSVILETKQLCKFYGAGENQVKAVCQLPAVDFTNIRFLEAEIICCHHM